MSRPQGSRLSWFAQVARGISVRPAAWSATLVLGIVVLGACSRLDPGSGSQPIRWESTSAVTEPARAGDASAAAVPSPLPIGRVPLASQATPSDQLLVGPHGEVLYVLGDAANADHCTGACAAPWHDELWLVLYKVSGDTPFTVLPGLTVEADSSLRGSVGYLDRPDGTRQVTYNGAPLYEFPDDPAFSDAGAPAHEGFTPAAP